MKQATELPLIEPLYSTYHYQGIATAIIAANPTLRNWYLDHAVSLTCTRKFLGGHTSPEISITDSSFGACPHFDRTWYPTQYLGGYVPSLIRRLLDAGYYVYFNSVDDYYLDGKSWYHERHFGHDGCICGYDGEDKTYLLYAYDRDWIYRKFRVPQKSFTAGRLAMVKKGRYGYIGGLRPKEENVVFSPETALGKIAEYMDVTEDFPPYSTEGTVSGTAVHGYLAKYLEKMFDGSVPYERMDRRVFRTVWEHKKAMAERIGLIEEAFSLGDSISRSYRSVVRFADDCRMLYAAHHMKRRDSLLPMIRQKLLTLQASETELLQELLQKTKGNQKQ